ncbi:putative acyl-protein synthetase [Halobacteriovorax marinus SJ]|uniref:Acyl-protein synthetase n=1 Tax=Halobacteriovorax marinus (strain ATCC BAA-682 / DSM 15412 / SJ) TaxID=862908 RepID=E1X572_HALMS|nr:acyl-protein synthase [Halobacteriovorax marinus]CBW25544.1 putative acyl-protein synthetase [Halobacteriovorax marinus SJ]
MKSLEVVDKKSLSRVEELCNLERPYEYSNENDKLFVEAMKENILWHRERNEFYRKLLNSRKFDTSKLVDIKDLREVPFIIANFFKYHETKSVTEEEVYLHLTSSGTTGQKSQIFFDEWTIGSAQAMVDKIFNSYGWISQEKVNYLLFTYEPEEGSKLGTAYTDNFLCKYAPINEVKYGLRFLGKDEGHKFDVFGCIEALQKFEKEGRAVRVFGFPSFFYFTLTKMKELGIAPLKLNKDSLVFLGGGWKGHQDKAISKKEFYSLCEEMLGIPNERLRDGFGSVEHCIPYVECSEHRFHIPVWSRVLIRDVDTLEPVEEGKPGYLNLISPYITSVPANSVLMGDLAIVKSECSCNLNTPWFEILGRAGISKNKSCAVAASELLEKI